MKLRTKIVTVFLLVLGVTVALIWLGLTGVLDSVSSHMLKKQAENSTLFLEHTLREANPEIQNITPQGVDVKFSLFKHVSDQSQSYEVSKILLIGQDFKVLAGLPSSETGTSYASHQDIRDAFEKKALSTVVETNTDTKGVKTTYIDVVSFFNLSDGTPLVLEVKLDFAKTTALLEGQYAAIETNAILAAVALLIALLGILLFLITNTAIRPVILITRAMESVGEGNLEVSLKEGGRDEFGTLSRGFNTMVEGIKEKLQLSHYVSKSTLEAVQSSVRDDQEHVPVRRDLVIFFSDIRGFTTFSEGRDPAEVIGLLNLILSLQSRIIRERGGDIDKFVGDEVMAVFEDPVTAAQASLEIQSEMKARIESFQGLAIGIGLHQGLVMQGDVGSDEIKDFTVIGDVVNTAARLQSIAGAGEILISETVLRNLMKTGTWTGKNKGALTLKGKSQTINTFLLTGTK